MIHQVLAAAWEDLYVRVLTITDGKPSFMFQTNEKVDQLKDKAVEMLFMASSECNG